MYAAVRQAKAKPGSAEELTERISEGALPLISAVRGFHAYYAIHAEDGAITTVNVFEDQAGAEECNRLLLTWIRENVAHLLEGAPTAMGGRVLVHKTA
jgi:Antibiotic biosynthesis monooxygenase